MPRPLPPHCWRAVSRHGRIDYVVKVRPHPQIRLFANPDTPEFAERYAIALAAAFKGETVDFSQGTVALAHSRARPTSQSLEWLIGEYKKSAEWASYPPSSQRKRELLFEKVCANEGATPFIDIDRKAIMDGRDARAHTPAEAARFIYTMRKLFEWAVAAEHMTVNPAVGVKNIETKSNKDKSGYPAITEADAAKFQKFYPLGTRERLWFEVFAHTGGRRGDAVRFGWHMVQDGRLNFTTQKSENSRKGKLVEVSLPIAPELARALAAGPCGSETWISGARGDALTRESFGNYFAAAMRKAGIEKSAHGMRKLAANRMAAAGVTPHEMNAWFGWTTLRMPEKYTDKFDRAGNAARAAAKLQAVRGNPIEANENATALAAAPGPRKATRKAR